MTEDGYGKGLAPAIFCCGAGTVRSDQWNVPVIHDCIFGALSVNKVKNDIYSSLIPIKMRKFAK